MDTTNLFVTVAVLAYVGFLIYLANQETAHAGAGNGLRWMLYGVISGMILISMNVVAVALMGGLPATETETALPIDPLVALVNMLIVGVAAVAAGAVVVSPPARLVLRRILGRHASYNPDSPVHLAAVVLCLAFVGVNVTAFVLSGGISGLATSLEESGIAADQTAFMGLLWVVTALLGVGLGLRRSWADAAQRLGLRRPTHTDVTLGIGLGAALFVGSIMMGAIWAALVSPEQFAEQTAASEQLAGAINSLVLVFVVSLSASIGEEIFFRGALQPVFGLVPTSLLFAVSHAQYTLTPAALWIVIVALAFGWLRQRTSTTAAIIAHFVYNFIPLLLSYLLAARMGEL